MGFLFKSLIFSRFVENSQCKNNIFPRNKKIYKKIFVNIRFIRDSFAIYFICFSRIWAINKVQTKREREKERRRISSKSRIFFLSSGNSYRRNVQISDTILHRDPWRFRSSRFGRKSRAFRTIIVSHPGRSSSRERIFRDFRVFTRRRVRRAWRIRRVERGGGSWLLGRVESPASVFSRWLDHRFTDADFPLRPPTPFVSFSEVSREIMKARCERQRERESERERQMRERNAATQTIASSRRMA